MTGYAFNLPGDFPKAQRNGINASYKDLSIVCNAIRYKRVSKALSTIERLMAMEQPILFSKYNKRMGARHELHGRKGAYPIKAAKEVKAAITNAIANAQNKGNLDPEEMFIIHASANKTMTISRQPSKGSLAWGRGMYGRSAMMHSNIELSKVEIALANGTESTLSENMKYFIKKLNPPSSKISTKAKPGSKAAAKDKKLPKTVDASDPEQMKNLANQIKKNLPAKGPNATAPKAEGAEKKEHTHEYHEKDTHDTHDHAHEHQHSHEGHEHQHEGKESK
ncbi:MAG: hypothetical protein KGH61_01825 [Candidatus Micrarchaeota archaeon]|nr:hypothetical protein [Candidatus Micrarchaeota archaeon]MDE1847669.1 hypothetical protein [Candidatus Micrarchaeota archaeon]MDE1864490.1 hypothetical protein [Candidatus Micrarchaeota archaeon]